MANEDIDYGALRREMVTVIAAYAQLTAKQTGKDRFDARVMQAMAKVPRHEFVPVQLRQYAYSDSPLPIGCTKTISQPFIVALMTDLLEIAPTDRVLEIGTGLGYQAAILAELAERVHTVEIMAELAEAAKAILATLGYCNIETRLGDGSRGWAEHGPYDKIIATAAPELIPPLLIDQLKPGGRMILPAGPEGQQRLMLVTKDRAGRTSTKEILEVRFSTMIVSH